MERISGPYAGYYVAAYAVESGGAFYGYAKICAARPRDVWDCTAFDKVTAPPCTSAEDAIGSAERRARDVVRALTRGGTQADGPARPLLQNRLMRLRALLPTSLAGWSSAAFICVLAVLVFAMLDGMACSGYKKWFAGSEADANDRLYQPAALAEGQLCIAGGSCAPAVLVEGLLSTDTVARIRDRAAHASAGTLTVCFNSPGGSYEAGSQASSLPPNLRTCVPNLVARPGAQPYRAICASACAWMWTAGSERVIYGRNSVGFHATYEYDAPACVPGNRFKGLLAAAEDWLRDYTEPRYDDRIRAARNELRLASLSMGPTEVFPLRADRAVALGLQNATQPPATFYVSAQPQAVTAR